MTDPALKTLNRLIEVAKGFEWSDENSLYIPGIELAPEVPAPMPAPRMGRNPTTGEMMVIQSNKPPFSYSCSPKNSTYFADTGADGNHFRFLHIDGEVREESPVVMTIPTNYLSEANFIVGEDLLDFLSLGCRTTYNVEDLGSSYCRQRMIDFLEHPERGKLNDSGGYSMPPFPEPVPEQKILIEEFNLKPWENVEERLEYLREKYHHLLVVEEGE